MHLISVETPTDLRTSRRYLKQAIPKHLAASAHGILGVDYDQREHALLFDRGVHTEETAEMLIGRCKGANLRVQFSGIGKSVKVTDADMTEINRHSGVELKAEDVAVFERYSCNDVLMRSPLKFTKAALQKFALDFNEGRGVHAQDQLPPYGHTGFRPIGRTFAAKVEKATLKGVEANWLIVRLYVVTTGASEERRQMISDLNSGILGYDSIGFRAGKWEFREVEGPDGESAYFYEVDDNDGEYPRLEATELSVLSELGNVYGAGSNRNRAGDSDEPHEKPPISTKSEQAIICVL